MGLTRNVPSVMLMLCVMVAWATTATQNARGSAATPQVNRVFYLTSPDVLSWISVPSGAPEETRLNKTSLEFNIPTPLLSGVTLSGIVTFSLWINHTSSTSAVSLDLNGTIAERLLGDTFADNHTLSFRSAISPSLAPRRYNFSQTLPAASFAYGSHLFLRLDAQTQPSASISLLWGVRDYPSLVILPLSGYVTLDARSPVEIQDRLDHPATLFDLNSTVKIVIFRANVFSAFGLQDIRRMRVNLTIVGPDLKPARGGTNLNMTQFPPSDSQPYLQPYPYITTWPFPSNATAGTYQVDIDVVDPTNVIAFSLPSSSSFVLFRGLYIPPPLNLIPYFAVAGVSAIAGVFYYKRRRTRSYLVPFDYFNTLTGGELDGGTVVSIEGNTGSGKTLLSEQLMYEDLKKGRPCVFVATADFPSNIRISMTSMGLDVGGYEKMGLLTFVDGYSSEAGQESREKFSIPSLGDLTTLGIKITSSLPSGSFEGGSLYFDSLTPLGPKTRPESIVSFVQSLGARVKGMSGKAFFTVGPSVDSVVQRQLEELADCVVQMEAYEESGIRKSRLRIAKYRARQHQQGWVIYTIEEGKGLIFYSKKPRK